MSTLNVEIPDEMGDDLQTFLEEHPHYLDEGELVRDALRHLMASPNLSEQAREDVRVSREQIDAGDVVSLDELE